MIKLKDLLSVIEGDIELREEGVLCRKGIYFNPTNIDKAMFSDELLSKNVYKIEVKNGGYIKVWIAKEDDK